MKLKKQFRMFLLPGMLLVVTLAVMMLYGKINDLFVSNVWYDKIMHTLGGAGACVLACLIIANLPNYWRAFVLRFVLKMGLPMFGRVSGLFIGWWWEVAETHFPAMTDYVLQGQWDTCFDLVFDVIGGHTAGKIYNRIREKFP